MSSGPSDDLNAEINVTPLVDVMLVLLIIFMITAPMMNKGVDLDLPAVQAQRVEDEQGKLILSISRNRQLSLGSTPIKWAELKVKLETNNRLAQEKQATGSKILWVEGDKDLPYAVVLTAMSVAKEAGVDKVQLLTDPAAEMNLGALDEAVVPAAPAAPGAP